MESLKEHYIPLVQSEDSNSSISSGSERDSIENANKHLQDEPGNPSMSKRSDILTRLLVVILFIIAFFQSITIASLFQCPQNQNLPSLSGAIPMKDVDRTLFLQTSFLSENDTETSEAWDKIEAGHGEVSIDPEWALAHGLPPSMLHPFDPPKMVYSISAYHAIHCLKYIREHYIALKEGKEITWNLHHDLHCFDSLRQNVMCTADDNLLYATGHMDAGYGQEVKCKDWDALREWATERTSCYHDHQGSLAGHWARCDGGEDGLPRGSLL